MNTRKMAEEIVRDYPGYASPVDAVESFLTKAIADERERCATIADKQADILRRAAHVVQQPTEEVLRIAELAIMQLNDAARAIRRDSTGEEGS